MQKYELQRAVGAYNEWHTQLKFIAENKDEAHKIAAEYISSLRMIFGEKNIRIIEVAYEGSLYDLNYQVEDDDKYLELREMQLAEEAKMHLVREVSKKTKNDK